MMNRRILSVVSTLLSLSLSSANEVATLVSVMEVGDGPSVVRHTSSSQGATVDGVKSFWTKLHLSEDKFVKQQPGMAMVPDFFNHPKSGVVVHLKNIEYNDDSIESFYVNAAPVKLVPSNVVEDHTNIDSFRRALIEKINSDSKLDSICLDASKIPLEEISSALKSVGSSVSGKVVFHIVSEAPLGRRLEEQNNENDNNGDDAAANDDNYAVMGYYNDAGYWITNFKSMEQIQYTNVVLWTTIGLVVIVTYATFLLMNMPLMADTLLFGESAKMAAAET